jgi:SAM-dependent methyltransferase
VTYHPNLLRGDFFVLRSLTAFLQRVLPQWLGSGVAVADIGCGEQPLRRMIEELGGKYTGIDLCQNRQGTVEMVADITDVPLPDGSFGLILCTEVLEHIPDTSAAFAELSRLCKAGGAIIITTPFAYPLHEEPNDYVRLTPAMVRRSAVQHGLEVVELTTAGDELQVAATVWCNLWSRAGAAKRSRLRSAWNLLMRVPVNLAVLGLSPLLHSALPRKYFLSTCCVLRKPA